MFTFTDTPSSLRILHRSALDDSRPCHFHTARKPSLLDLCLDGDSHVAMRRDEEFDIFVGHIRLSSLRGTQLDWMTFHNLLFQLRG